MPDRDVLDSTGAHSGIALCLTIGLKREKDQRERIKRDLIKGVFISETIKHTHNTQSRKDQRFAG